MKSLPLISNFHSDSALLCRGNQAFSHRQFVASATSLAECLPPGPFSINLCTDRGNFALAFAAACIRGQTNLLPLSRAPTDAQNLASTYAGSYVINDEFVQALNLSGTGNVDRCPDIPADHIAAITFTSGSSGRPSAHAKTWRDLVLTAQLCRNVLLPDSLRYGVLATVPPQHMYGLETTVFFALSASCSIDCSLPFFPADIRDRLNELPTPRVLITTPVHLHALVTASIRLPLIAKVISATAPLTRELAKQAEEALGAPVFEIYGCTEAGSMATRRTIISDIWELHPGMRFVDGSVRQLASNHLAEPVTINDHLEPVGNNAFILLGRDSDQLKVFGKRASLADLTRKLLAIPGVTDGAFFVPNGAERPAALVVAQISEAEILEALASQLDPLFLPRPLRKVLEMPRDSLGKLSRERMTEMVQHG